MEYGYHGYAQTCGRLIEADKDNSAMIFSQGCFLGNVGKVVPLFRDHDESERIGDAFLEAEDEIGLKFRANFYQTKIGREIERKVKEGILSNVSIHMRATDGLWNDEKTLVACTCVRVFEVSVVDEGGNPDTWIAPIETSKTLAGTLAAFEVEVARTKISIQDMDAAKRNGFYGLRSRR